MQIRLYSKQELAMLYFPDTAPDTAMKRLNRWINRIPGLAAELETCPATGKNSKHWTRRQVEIIVRYLDEP